jgi:hypothetical protein
MFEWLVHLAFRIGAGSGFLFDEDIEEGIEQNCCKHRTHDHQRQHCRLSRVSTGTLSVVRMS